MKTLLLVLFFTDGTSIKINHEPRENCDTLANMLNNSISILMYQGERVADGRVIQYAKWECK